MPFHNKKFELSPRLKLGVGRGYTQNQILKTAAIVCLVFALGLSFNAVNLMVKSQPSAKTAEPQVLGASDTKNIDQDNAVQFTSYAVQKGDTLFNIAQKFNISWTTLATLNNLKSPFYLKPGQTLKVPKQ
ncbi:MAG: LysM domain-containing protein [Candidatus Doudnabacteria bacterium]|jgi:hypothetical protein